MSKWRKITIVVEVPDDEDAEWTARYAISEGHGTVMTNESFDRPEPIVPGGSLEDTVVHEVHVEPGTDICQYCGAVLHNWTVFKNVTCQECGKVNFIDVYQGVLTVCPGDCGED